MFSRILKYRATKWTAVFLIMAITLTLSYSVNPVRVMAQQPGVKLKIAAVGIENLTDKEVLIDSYGIDMMLAEMTDVESISLIPEEQIKESLGGVEPNPDIAISVGEALGADAVVVGFISDLSFSGTEEAEVEVGLSMYSVSDGSLLSEAVVLGHVARLGFSGTPEKLAELAVREGVRTATGFLFENLNHYGVVTLVRGNEVLTNLTEKDNVRPGAEIAVLRGYKQIASIEVDNVSLAHSSGKILEQKKGLSVKPGDKARLVYTPAVYEKTGGFRKVPKKKKISPLLIGLLAVGVIAAVSKGGNDAEGPYEVTGQQSIASRDGRAVVYNSQPFDADYLPASPVKVTGSTDEGLAPCWNSNSLVTPIESTAYDFTLSTSPKQAVLPGNGYKIIFDMTDIDYQDSTKLKCATCNEDLGEWEILSASYGKYSSISNHYGVACMVTHFTPYLVVTDNRKDPLSKPDNFRVQCGDGKVSLYWEQIEETGNVGYIVYECSATTCSTVKETITSASTTNVEYTVPNDSQVCYAVQGLSSNTEQDADMTQIKCTVPSASTDVCKIQDITLVNPTNNSTISSSNPDFVFIGSGIEDYYMLYVQDTENEKTILYSTKVEGEGSDSEDQERKTFEVSYSGDAFQDQGNYKWYVEGYLNTLGKDLSSGSWYFTYDGSIVNTECRTMTEKPDTVAPTNGIQLQTDQPSLMWKPVENAASYIVTVRNESSEQVYQTIISSGTTTSVNYSGTALVDEVTYYWEVIADNGCAEYTYGNTAQFTKVPSGGNPDLPIPQWVDGEGLQPVIVGDQLVSLQWYEEPDSQVEGYIVYRTQNLSQFSSNSAPAIDIVYKDQLGGPLPDSDCPVQFSEASPGYCDISITNGELYYYKIACIQNGDIAGNTSSLQMARAPLQRPELIGPGNVTSQDVSADTPSFMWFPVNGENIDYIVKLIDESSEIIIWQPTTTATSRTYDGPSLELGKSYRWTVTALNDAVQSEESTAFRFVKKPAAGQPDPIDWCGDSYCAPQQSEAYSTDDTNDSITLFWEKPDSENIDTFIIYRCQDSPGICDTSVATTGNFACGTKTKVVCFTDTYLERGHEYYYNIEAVDSTATSSDKSETLGITLLLKGPTPIAPIYDQVVFLPTPTFTWYEESGATEYHLEISKKADGFGNPGNYIWSYVTTGDSAAFNEDNNAKEPLKNPSDPDIAGNQYVWRVCSSNSKFTIYTSSCSNTMQFYKNLKPPETVSPMSGEQIIVNDNSPLIFKWTRSPGAAGYTVRICSRQGSGSDCRTLPIIWQSNITGEDSIETSLPSSIDIDVCEIDVDPTCSEDGTYIWEIRAFDEYGSTSGSWENINREMFYVVENNPPKLLSPQDGEIIGPNLPSNIVADFYGNPTYEYTITFEWAAFSQASTYIIRLEAIEATEEGSTEDNPHVVTIYEGPQSTPWTISETDIMLTAGWKYRWNVTTQGSQFKDTNASEFYTGLPYPRLLSPAHGEQVMLVNDCDGNSSALCVHFDWDGGESEDFGILSHVVGAASYDIEILKNGSPYLCEPQFTFDPENPPDPPITNTRNSFCDLSTPSVVNGDVFTWRVRARDALGETTQSGTGFASPWSSYRSFTVLIPPVQLASPPDNTAQCDPYYAGSFDEIETNCTIIDCVDMSYYWSPIPMAEFACYRIEISDTMDFRNLIFADNSAAPIHGSFPCPLQQCYQAPLTEGHYVPMTNGVVYYWRVGSSVAPTEGGDCGSTWVYSDVWEYYKRPPIPRNLQVTASQDTLGISWDDPADCTQITGQATSIPGVPPGEGGYYLLLVKQGSCPAADTDKASRVSASPVSLTGQKSDQDYCVCVVTVDASGFEDHPGHRSNKTCLQVHTQPDDTEE